jgi:DNA-binding transcriptional regulator/RsmH inhibitor MraZ
MSQVRMDERGRMVVPAHLRRELDLCPDDVLVRRDQMLEGPQVDSPAAGWRRLAAALARRLR